MNTVYGIITLSVKRSLQLNKKEKFKKHENKIHIVQLYLLLFDHYVVGIYCITYRHIQVMNVSFLKLHGN